MPTKPLDRLMFIQGGLCFFCRQPLPRDEASIEHLHGVANGGGNNEDNCVACCKSVNSLLGSMSVKEKFQVVLNQKGQFRCPNGTVNIKGTTPPQPSGSVRAPANALSDDTVRLVVANLKRRGNARPSSVKTLTNSLATLLPKGTPKVDLERLISRLKSEGVMAVDGDRVEYRL